MTESKCTSFPSNAAEALALEYVKSQANDWTPSDMAEKYHAAYEIISSVLNSKNKTENSK